MYRRFFEITVDRNWASDLQIRLDLAKSSVKIEKLRIVK
jgi:hypothetical protein